MIEERGLREVSPIQAKAFRSQITATTAITIRTIRDLTRVTKRVSFRMGQGNLLISKRNSIEGKIITLIKTRELRTVHIHKKIIDLTKDKLREMVDTRILILVLRKVIKHLPKTLNLRKAITLSITGDHQRRTKKC